MPATSKAPDAWSTPDKLVAVIHSSPRMSDQKELQLQNEELIRESRRLESELLNKEKALAEAAMLLILATKSDLLWPPKEESWDC